MKFIGLQDQYKITREKMISTGVVTGIVLLCVLSSAGIVSMMNYKANRDIVVQDEKVEQILDETTTSEETSDLSSGSSTETTTETTTATSSETALSFEQEAAQDTSGRSEGSSDTSSSEEAASSQDPTTTTTTSASEEATTTTKASKETTKETTKATTTKATTSATTLKEYYNVVYATTTLNVRSGPGKEYDRVKQLNEGDAIDVVAKTENGWYKTINGNYVLQSLTTTDKPTTTTTTTKATTTTTTTAATKSTTKATTKSTKEPTTTSKTKIDGKNMVSLGKFKCTFYGPQPLPDGGYSTTTATGTKCKQGRTIAADWSVLPAGTVIYVKNDPLGGDGYYTVEDKGSGVRGNMIDIYVDDESAWDTTSVEVYLVK